MDMYICILMFRKRPVRINTKLIQAAPLERVLDRE